MSLFLPDYFYKDVFAIDLEDLRARGVRALLVDLDNTLLPRDEPRVGERHIAWASRATDADFRICLVSNNWHARVEAAADELACQLVPKALKPLPFAFLTALRKLGAKRHEAAVVGDQMFTDILGGNLLGMTTVLVEPQSATDLPHTLLLRRIERLLLAGRRPLP